MKISKRSCMRATRAGRRSALNALLWLSLIVGAPSFGAWRGPAQADVIAPNANLETRGIPKVPAALAATVKRYTAPYGLPLAGWDPSKREVWIKGISSVSWLARVETPGGSQRPLTYIQASGVYDLYLQPQGKQLVYNRDTNGNEVFQMFFYDLATRASTPLSDGQTRDTEPVWSNAGDRIIYSSAPAGGGGVNLRLVDPRAPQSNRLIVASTGSYLKAYDWSPDDHTIVFCDFISNRISTLWLLDVASGQKRPLMKEAGKDASAYYVDPHFSKDGKGVYVLTDRDAEARRLAYIALADGRIQYLSGESIYDVSEFQVAPEGRNIAFIVNEEGLSRLFLLDTKTGQRRSVDGLPAGVFSDLKWRSDAVDLAFNVKSPRTPNDVYSVAATTGKIERWAKSVDGGIALESLPLPELMRWRSFDERTISGFLYRPLAKFSGKRPVIIDLHGGPREQYRPLFGYEHNYFLNELGIAKIYPNVRGSSGFGKTFLTLDDGFEREDAVKDVGALLDWIKTQPDLDASRVMVQGGSYGGYLALAAAVKYGDRIRAVVSDCGMSNLASFLAHTDSWTRELQRDEFGDESDPKVKAFLDRIAPLNHAEKIKQPLLIIQGKNDPRVPVAEAEAIAQAVQKNGTPVWYLLAKNEGHGFARRENWEFRLYTIILFAQQHLLGQV